MHQFRWAEVYFSDQAAPFQEERELGRRECEIAACRLPRRGKPAALEALCIEAHASAVPEQDFRACPIPAHEEEELPVREFALHPVAHDGGQRVERLAHVDWLPERVHCDPPR